MARYKGTQASHLYEKSMHTLCTIVDTYLSRKDSADELLSKIKWDELGSHQNTSLTGTSLYVCLPMW